MAQITIMPPLTTELFVAAFFAMLEVCLQKCVPPYNSQTPPHTLCKPQNPSCTILVSGFSEKDKKEVLQAHNDKRSMVAQGRLPGFAPAANMYELVSILSSRRTTGIGATFGTSFMGLIAIVMKRTVSAKRSRVERATCLLFRIEREYVQGTRCFPERGQDICLQSYESCGKEVDSAL